MTDKAPERIWAHPEQHPNYADWVADGWCTTAKQEGGKWAEYVRADLLEAAQARIAELEAEAERRDEQIQTMIEASGQTCACGYDRASDICLGHISHHRKALAAARAEALEEAAAKADDWTLTAEEVANGTGWPANVGENIGDAIRALKGGSNG